MESADVIEDPVALYTEEEIKEIKEKFESFDVDANGGLTTVELKRRMFWSFRARSFFFAIFQISNSSLILRDLFLTVLQILGYNPTTGEVEEMFQEMDSDGTGQLELPEFMTLMKKIEKYKQIKRGYVYVFCLPYPTSLM